MLIGPIKVKEELLWNTRRVRVEVGRVLIPLSIGRKRKINLEHACIRILDPRQFLLGTHKDTIQFRADTPTDCKEWVEALVTAKKKAGFELNEFDDVDFATVQQRKQPMSSAEVKEQLRKFRRKVTILSVRYNSPPGSTTAQRGRGGFTHPLSDSSVIDEEDFGELTSSTEESEDSDDEAAIEAFRRKYGGQVPSETSAGSNVAVSNASNSPIATPAKVTPQRRTSSSRIRATSSTAKAAAASARRRSTHSTSTTVGTSTPHGPQDSAPINAAKTPGKDDSKRAVLSSTVLAAAERSAANLNSVWRRAFDKERKRYYYFNKRTKETSWKRPPNYVEADPSGSTTTATKLIASTVSQPSGSGSPKKVQAAATSHASSLQSDPLQSVALAKKVVGTLSPSVRAAARASKSKVSTNAGAAKDGSAADNHPSVPRVSRTISHDTKSGWARIWDDKKLRYYYHNKETNETVWTVPLESIWSRAAGGLPSAAAAAPGRIRSKKSGGMMRSNVRKSQKHSNDAAVALGGSGDVWLEFYDSARNRPYFYNKATKTTVWKRPTSGRIVKPTVRKAGSK